jgi:hypothetical protein
MHADIETGRALGRLARPRTWHHQRGAGRKAFADRLLDCDVCCVARPEIVAIDDQEAIGSRMAELLG